MTRARHGAGARCERTTCTTDGPADHPGEAHLDPRDRDRFDGNSTTLRAASIYVRAELQAVQDIARTHPELAETIDVGVYTALRELNALRRQVAHVQVDADNKICEAGRRALDCEDHGKTISDLESRVAHWETSHDRSERGRLALLGLLQAVNDLVDAYREDEAIRANITPDAIITALEGAAMKTSTAHARAWKSGSGA